METVEDLLERWDIITVSCRERLGRYIPACSECDTHPSHYGVIPNMTPEDFVNISDNCALNERHGTRVYHAARAIERILLVESIPTASMSEIFSKQAGLNKDFSLFEMKGAKDFQTLMIEETLKALRLRADDVKKWYDENYPPPSFTYDTGLSFISTSWLYITDSPQTLAWSVIFDLVHNSRNAQLLRVPTYLKTALAGKSVSVRNLGLSLPEDSEEMMSTLSVLCQEHPFKEAIELSRALSG